jgi:hypothetical protein
MAAQTKQARATDRSLVSEEPWEVATALEAAKNQLKGSESREKIMQILNKKLS